MKSWERGLAYGSAKEMFVSKKIATDHKDVIHDVSYDFYGKRMATCSSDQSVKVWDMGADGQWHCTAGWKTHSGSVWRVNWAHPEFGQVLATCSFDRTAAIWEEQVGEQKSSQQTTQTHWVKRASLVDSRTAVNDVKFAPQHLGLQLATVSTDGQLRIYEAPDVMNLSQWSLMCINYPAAIAVTAAGCAGKLLAYSGLIQCHWAYRVISWVISIILQFLNLDLDVTEDTYNLLGFFSNCLHHPRHRTGHVLSCKPGTSCLSWNPSRVHPAMIVVGMDDPGAMASTRLQIFEYTEEARKWLKIHSIVGVVFDPVHDVAFAPNLGRSSHALAVASKDVDIIHLVPSGKDPHGYTKLDVRHPSHLEHQGAQVWRVEWNVTGTILASSGDDGCIRLWKANYLENWKCISMLKADGSSAPVAAPHALHYPSQGPHGAGTAGAYPKEKPNAWMKELGDL